MEEVRSKLVIIGNGFDLAHDFKTSYNDFMLWYLSNCIRGCVKDFGNYEDKLITISNPKNIRLSTTDLTYSLLNIQDFNDDLGSRLLVPKPSKFLEKLIQTHKKYNWVDIENAYYESVVSYYNNIKHNSSSMDWVPELRKLNEQFECLRDKLEEYLMEVQEGTINKFKPGVEGKINIILEEIFSKIIQENSTYKKIPKKVFFLNFNYTDTIEKFLKLTPRRHASELIYIHGKLSNEENPVIFGFGDETDEYYEKIENLKINDFLNNFKSFWYFKTDNYQKLLNFICEQPYDIEILGHSCGLSDRVLLSTIFQHDNCESIKIHYHAKSETKNDFFSKTQEISRHFRDKAKMRRLIVNFRNCDSMNYFSLIS